MAKKITGTWESTQHGYNVFSGSYSIEYKSRTSSKIYFTVKAELKAQEETDRAWELYIYNSYGQWELVASENADYKKTYAAGEVVKFEKEFYIANKITGAGGTWTSKIQYQARRSDDDVYRSDQKATSVDYDPWQYTVKYNATGGVGAPQEQKKTYGVDLKLSGLEPAKAYYTFAGWNTNSSGTGTAYSPAGTYTANSDVTLYAQWLPEQYSIDYDANGGSGAPAGGMKKYGVPYQLSKVTPVRGGYTFLGWNEDDKAEYPFWKAGATYTGDGPLYLYAVWQANPDKTITYDARGGTGAPAPLTVHGGTTIAVTQLKPTKASTTKYITITFDKVEPDASCAYVSKHYNRVTEYTFSHWSTHSDGTGTKYKAGDRINLTYDMTLYANYAESYSGGNTLPDATLDQYTLAGWSASLTDIQLLPKIYSPASDITVYAVWQANGMGGMLKVPADKDMQLTTGQKLRLVGFKDAENDGVYTVASSSFKNGTQTIYFEENFNSSGQQDCSDVQLEIWGDGTYVPDFDYICSSNNRLYGCSSKNRTIYASALGDPTDFWTFEGTNLDAYQVAVGSAGDFTGCIALNSSVLFMKQHCIHKLIGDYPAEYALYTYNNEGVSEGNGMSLVDYRNTAMYVSEHGIAMYNGSTASTFSKELGEEPMHDAVGAVCGEDYALCVRDTDGKYHAYLLDLEHGIWLDKGDGEVLCYAHLGDEDYAVIKQDGKNSIYNLTSDMPADDDWQITFKPFYEEASGSFGSRSHIFEKKRYTHITIRLELPKGSWIKAEISPDGLPWYTSARMEGKNNGVQDFVIRTPRCDKLQLRLSGNGPMTIIAIDREYITGSRR